MTQVPPAEPLEESLGALVAAASDHISTLVRAEIELAKVELRFDAKRVGAAAVLFGAAAFMAPPVPDPRLVRASPTSWSPWACGPGRPS